MTNQPYFDVFLAHNSQDKPQVRAIAAKLKRRGLKVWLDEEQIPPGRPFQDVIQQALQNVRCAAIFISPKGLGKWQVLESRSLLTRFVDADIPVIPILLPGVEGIPEDLLFLKELNYVKFESGIDDIEALDKLESGIRQKTVRSQPKNYRHFDIFLCYNDEDSNEVKQIAEQLKERQIKPWLIWEVPAGSSWQSLLTEQIDKINSVAVFIGNNGGPWQKEEIESFIQEFIEQKCPVIPVILPNVLQESQLPIYLRRRMKVDFRQLDPEPITQLVNGIPEVNDFRQDKAEPLDHLEWGITQRKPEIAPIVLEENNSSSSEINFAYLEKLLVAEKWQEADRETKIILLKLSGKTQDEKLGVDDIRNFSCEILSTIDELWINYSDGRFGFSVQNRIWHKTRKKSLRQILTTDIFDIFGNSDNDNNNEKNYWYSFGERVGWYKEYKQGQKNWVQYQALIFDINAPEGHLPYCREWWKRSRAEHEPGRFSALMSRLENCQK
ncbi:MAG: TIR domain-containing protein [Geitlerinemataceae cyanobacterium]